MTQFMRQETPEEKLKRLIVEVLSKAISLDTDIHQKKYCISVKHFIRLLKKYMTQEVIDKIEEKHNVTQEKVKKIQDDKNKTDVDKEAEIVKLEYELMDEVIVYGLEALFNSPIIQREMEGIIISGKKLKDTKELAKKIQSADVVDTVISDADSRELEGD